MTNEKLRLDDQPLQGRTSSFDSSPLRGNEFSLGLMTPPVVVMRGTKVIR